MKEILFRARKTANNEWCEGYFVKRNGVPIIWENTESQQSSWEVDERTLCQFTGLLDKNGTRIFEGDVFLHNDGHHAIYGIVKFGEFRPSDSSQKFTGFYLDWKNDGANRWGDWLRCDLCFWINERMCELIGNIHDNTKFKEVM